MRFVTRCRVSRPIAPWVSDALRWTHSPCPRHTSAVSNRRTRFREHMGRLNAAASPHQALDSGFYVAPPAELSIAHELSARLELQPASTHLVVGGVGSGKTTEMLAACQNLANDEEIAAIYVDVSEVFDLATFTEDTLLFALMGGLATRLATWRGRDAEVSAALSLYHEWDSPYESMGVSSQDVYTQLVGAFTQIKRTPIVLMDSLDRLQDPLRLESALKAHASLIRRSHMGLVVAGSIRLRHGIDRSLRDLFDQSYSAPYISADEASGLGFLCAVLRARVPASLIDDQECQHLARLSGGVLRDLLTLAQAAVNETYIRGGEQVSDEHVAIAADNFGRKQLLGLDSEEIEKIQRVRTHRSFVQTSPKDLGLLLTRHILEYQDSRGKTLYRVHPTLEPLLEQIAGAT